MADVNFSFGSDENNTKTIKTPTSHKISGYSPLQTG
jgi:hypothetical protein